MGTDGRFIEERFGDFVLVSRRGMGGMAEVFVGHRVGAPDELMAIKRLLPTFAEDEDITARFFQEFELAERLDHPTIIEVYEHGIHRGYPYIAMELVEGVSLRILGAELDRTGEPPYLEGAYIMEQVARGLAVVHAATGDDGHPLGLVHRDISPRNVLVARGGRVKIIDFGVAKTSRSRKRTDTGIVVGTYSYMSPERIRNEPLDGRADVFSLGVTIYELITGERLFPGQSPFDIASKVLETDVTSMVRAMPSAPPELQEILVTSMARDKSARFSSAGELAARCRELIDTHGDRRALAARLDGWVRPLVPVLDREAGRLRREQIMVSAEDRGEATTDRSGLPEITETGSIEELISSGRLPHLEKRSEE